MRQYLLFVVFLLSLSSLKSQTWDVVGSRGFVMNLGDCFTAVSPDNTPYIITRAGHGISVMKYVNDQWKYVGDTIVGGGFGVSLCFDKFGTPYIAYTDETQSRKGTVLKFNGTSWMPVGIQGFTPGCATYLSMAFDSQNNLHVAFRDKGDVGSGLGPNGYRASVMKYNGNSWEYLGQPGFSPSASVGGAAYLSLAFDRNDKPYVGFTDYSNDFIASVMSFDGLSWSAVGGVISDGQTANTSLVIDKNNVPYLAFWDKENGGKATVKKYDGINWVSVGNEGLTNGVAEFIRLIIDKNDVLYLIFEDYDNSEKASVVKFDGHNWVPVGNLGFSGGRAYNTALAVDSNGTLYACYWDCPIGWYATVMKYAAPVSVSDETTSIIYLNVYPNPSKDVITLECLGCVNDLSVIVRNQIGQLISSKYYSSVNNLKDTFDLSKQGKGVYFIELRSAEIKEVRKVVIE